MVQNRPILGRFCTMRYKVTDIVDRGKLTGPKGNLVARGELSGLKGSLVALGFYRAIWLDGKVSPEKTTSYKREIPSHPGFSRS